MYRMLPLTRIVAGRSSGKNLLKLCQSRLERHPRTWATSLDCSSARNVATSRKLQAIDAPNKKQDDRRQRQTITTNWRTGGPITWRSLTIGGGVLAALYFYTRWLKEEKKKRQQLEKSRSFGKPAIGGEFELIDSHGKLRSSKEWAGKWMLVYFGFTNCPDICPEELEKLATVIEKITKAGTIELVPIFISVDPERDTPENVGKYLAEFSPKFIGLTGTKEQVEKATRAYRVYYSAGPRDEDNDYIVDHTIISYLISPNGDLADYFGQTKTAEDIEASIRMQYLKFNSIP